MASLAIGATSCALRQPPRAGTRLPCPLVAPGAAGTRQQGPCAHPGAGIGTGSQMPSQRALGGLKNIPRGLKTPPGHCVPTVGTRAPSPCHSAWPLALPCGADAEMLAAPPGPPAPRSPPRVHPALGGLRTQPGRDPGPQACRHARRCLPGVFSPALCRGVSDPVCTAVPGPCGGGWKTVPCGSECQHPLLAPGHVLPRRTQLSPPRGDTGAWLPPQFLQGQILPPSLARGLEQCWAPPRTHGEPDQP